MHPALTVQLVDALIKADQDFDMLIVPNMNHGWDPYLTRQMWNYFVRHVHGQAPPSYRIGFQ